MENLKKPRQDPVTAVKALSCPLAVQKALGTSLVALHQFRSDIVAAVERFQKDAGFDTANDRILWALETLLPMLEPKPKKK